MLSKKNYILENILKIKLILDLINTLLYRQKRRFIELQKKNTFRGALSP